MTLRRRVERDPQTSRSCGVRGRRWREQLFVVMSSPRRCARASCGCGRIRRRGRRKSDISRSTYECALTRS